MTDAPSTPTAAELRAQAEALLTAAAKLEQAPAVDSRQSGFNPEVEASHAAAAAASAAAATKEDPPPPPPEPPLRAAGEVLLALLTSICDHVGNRPTHIELLDEYKKALGQ
jgi:hypothetical protein